MPIVKINHSDKRINSIESIDGHRIELNDLVSTIPIHTLAKAMVPPPPNHILDEIEMLEYRSIMICVLFLDIERFSENASIYFPDEECPFTRIYEPKNRSEEMAPNEKTCIVIEIPVGTNTINIGTSKDSVYKMVVQYLTEKNLLEKKSIINYNIVNVNYAYPIIYKDTEIRIKKIFSYFQGFENLYLIGRNADFEYLHTHHIIDRSEKLVNRMVS
jgi:protoporphyrinogen oxidase